MKSQAKNKGINFPTLVGVAAGDAVRGNSLLASCRMSAQRRRGFSSAPGREYGVALVVAICFLIAISLMGLAASRGTMMQQKMSSNFYDRQIAFQNSEAALRYGEDAVVAASALPGAGGFIDCSAETGGTCMADPTDDTGFPSGSKVRAAITGYTKGGNAEATPEVLVQYMGIFEVPDTSTTPVSTTTANFYKITAWSGPKANTDRASVTLQEVYRF